MAVVIDPGPGNPCPIVATIEPVGPVDGSGKKNRRVGFTRGGFAESHSKWFVYVSKGRHVGTPVRETIEVAIGGNPKFPRLPENRPGNDKLSVTVGIAPINGDGIHLGKARPTVSAFIDRYGAAVDPLSGIGGVKGGSTGPIGSYAGSTWKAGTSRPTATEGGGVGRRPISAKGGNHHSGTVRGDGH